MLVVSLQPEHRHALRLAVSGVASLQPEHCHALRLAVSGVANIPPRAEIVHELARWGLLEPAQPPGRFVLTRDGEHVGRALLGGGERV